MNKHDWVLKTKGLHDCNKHPCSVSPCLNNGKCIEIDHFNYRCECTNKNRGEFCEKLTDPCLSNPCEFGSKCINNLESFICECPPSRSGSSCEMGK